jgi:3-hydroxybutyryl-CoA dehydrogenase
MVAAKAAKSLLPRLLGVVGAGQMGAGIAQVRGFFGGGRKGIAMGREEKNEKTRTVAIHLPSHLASLSSSLPHLSQVAATKGLDVVLVDPSPAALDRGLAAVQRSLARAVTRSHLSAADADAALARIRREGDVAALASADFVVEAAPEDEALKKSIFARLDATVTAPDAVLASNTSSISITRLGAGTARPSAVVGMHFMNPVPAMPLVELVRGIETSDETAARAAALAACLGKTVTRAADRPGFIVNRVLMPYINEAFYCLMEGVGSAEDIDRGMVLGCNVPMGPLALADFIGLDTVRSILKVMADGTGDPKYRPCPLLVQYVDAGRLGKKTHRGVFTYARQV